MRVVAGNTEGAGTEALVDGIHGSGEGWLALLAEQVRGGVGGGYQPMQADTGFLVGGAWAGDVAQSCDGGLGDGEGVIGRGGE